MDPGTEIAGLVADLLASLEAMRRDGVDVVPLGAVPGLPTSPLPELAPGGTAGGPGASPPRGSPPRAGVPAAAAFRPEAAPAPRPAMPPRPEAPAAPVVRAPIPPPSPSPAAPTAGSPTPGAEPARAAAAGLFGGRWAAALADPAADLRGLYRDVGDCRRCVRCDTRGRIVLGEGAARAPLMVLTGAPTLAEDSTGRLFAGEAGVMLDRMLVHVLALERENVHVAAALLCAGRAIQPDEAQACREWLRRRIAIVAPRVILGMGPTVATALGLPAVHGWARFESTDVFLTFHPEELLLRPGDKRRAMEHLHEVRGRIG